MPKEKPNDRRADLAAMLVPLGRALMSIEQPILDERHLTMWGYAVLLRLDEAPLRTQAALAQSIGADKTRLIAILDELQKRGWIRREPDPADRRVHLVSITDAGVAVRDSAQAAIQHKEELVLATLPDRDRSAFLRSLQALSALSVDEIKDLTD